ncbi:MAG: DHH family phosphoesterase [Lachnospiraceae bacterium]|nr:DHH family phosphoesterase [Lachnospiraceae bacterium]
MKATKNSSFSIALYMRWPLILSALLILLNLILFAADTKAALIMLVFTVVFVIASMILYFYSRKSLFTGLVSFAQGFGSAEARLLDDMSSAAAICDLNGALIWVNRSFEELFMPEHSYSHIQSVFPDITKEILTDLDEMGVIHSSFGDRRYLIEMNPSSLADTDDVIEAVMPKEADKPVVAVMVTDETELIRYRKLYEETRSSSGLIYVDNYDEALESIEEVRRSLLTALVDRRISNYVNSMNGIVKKTEKDKYFFFVMEKDINRMIEDRFSILEEVKTINIGNEQSLTLSIGVGRGGKDYQADYESARAAIDLALGRGGDQAVVKNGDNVTYFGGKTAAKEKNARVKARVKAQALQELLNSCDKLIVMGHKTGDVDSLGSSVGMWKIATSFGKKAHIVMNGTTKSLEPLYRAFKDNPDYPDDMFVSGEQAMDLLDRQTVVTVVDVNRPSYTEEPRLLQRAEKIVVIDHHRKGTESVEKATLSYIEPYASSACEMVAEIIQYIDAEIRLASLEADAMYGGIVIDTQNFVNQTGVRTFEAAAFLKRQGASIPKIRKMFRDSLNDSRAKAGAIERAEIYREHYAIGRLDPTDVDSPTVVGAQAANGLLNVDGIKAAFVVTPFNDQIYISARSIDEVNVQLLMEKLGGGGHMTVAGAQLKDMTADEAADRIRELLDEMEEKGEH